MTEHSEDGGLPLKQNPKAVLGEPESTPVCVAERAETGKGKQALNHRIAKGYLQVLEQVIWRVTPAHHAQRNGMLYDLARR